MTVAEGAASAPRTRPRDRKRQIEEAAATAFAQSGYHSVGMQDIAAMVGISAPALYRHFPNKYALFVRTAFALVEQLIEATDAADTAECESPEQARALIDELLDAVIETTLRLRATGGLYRWEGRYLERADRTALTAEFQRLRDRFERPHRVLYPGLSDTERSMTVLAGLSVVASVTAHHTVVAARNLRTLLRSAAWRAFDLDLAHPQRELPEIPDTIVRPGTRRREQLLDAAVTLFAARGFPEVTIEELAAEVDLTPSGVYRHFASKPDVLLAVCERAAVALERATLSAREEADSPLEALRRLCTVYVAFSFENYHLTRIYFAEVGNLPADDQRRLRSMQRAHIADWVALLQAVRPTLSGREATVLVHAGFGVVTDQSPFLRERSPEHAQRLVALVEAALGI